MKFALKLLKSLEDSGQGICVFSKDLVDLLSEFTPKSFDDFSSRSYYFWKTHKRPIPLSVAIKIMEIKNLKSVEVEYFSIKGGNKIKFPDCENDAFCYILGVILGDGCLVHSVRGKRNSWYVQITSNSREKINYLSGLIWELFEVEVSVCDYDNYHDLYIFSKPLSMILANKYEIPIGLKYEKIKVPEVVRLRKSFRKSFIKGVFECDGNIYNYRGKKSVQLRQKSRRFLIDVREICEDVGVSFREPYYDKANNSWVLWTCKRSVVDNFIKKIGGFKIRLP
ncbi:MAG: hypothetical protein KJ592_04750 [Nanoarchaeota archaeon]|nr:hypothetical protein [Nanoarchaeota archaeon]